MPILNYTTEVPVTTSVNHITKVLVAHGATGILTEYDPNGEINALTFRVPFNGGSQGFRLPANWQGVLTNLNNDPKVENRYKRTEQAKRVAWRTLKDWVEAQMALIDVQMAELGEVFLPYMQINGRSFYEEAKRNLPKLLE